jgi:hypothetical protein
LFVSGPGAEPGKTFKTNADSVDVCPTVGRLLGLKTSHAKGRALKVLLR